MLSIRGTVLAAIAAAVLAPALVLWHLEQQLTREAQQPLIEQNRKAVLLMTANALVQPMWSLDESAIQQAARLALNEPNVLSLRLVERRPLTPPTVLVHAEEAPFEGVSLKSPILHEGETLGELEMWFDPDQIDRLLAIADTDPITIDLENQVVTTPFQDRFSFEIDPFRKHCLVNGLDEIGLTVAMDADIAAHEARLAAQRPWIAGAAERAA